MERKFKKKAKKGQRLFLSFKVPQEVRNIARDVKRELKNESYKLRFTDLEQLHLTIKFLGNDVSQESLDRIETTLPNVFRQFSSFKLKVSGVQFGFSKQTKPSVLFLEIEDGSNVDEIKSVINKKLKDLKLYDVIKKADRKLFTSHVTIARVDKDISKSFVKKVNSIIEDIEIPEVKFDVDTAHIIKSTLTKNGPQYSTIAGFSLGN